MKANHELHSAVAVRTALAPATAADSALREGDPIDLQGFTSCLFVVQTGALNDADATFAVKLFEGDAPDMSDEAEASPDVVLGDASFTSGDDNTALKVGYLTGTKRYVRIKVQPSANTGNATVGATALLYPGALMPEPA